MSNTITTNKFVELTYRIINQTNGEVIEQVEEPLGYVQGDNTLLFNQVTKELEGNDGRYRMVIIPKKTLNLDNVLEHF